MGRLDGGPDGSLLPTAGPGYIQVPDISNVEVVFETTDPLGDDHGPGSYTYPTDGVFGGGSYDLTGFSVGLSGENAVFNFDVAAPIGNPWGSPTGYSIQTFDLKKCGSQAFAKWHASRRKAPVRRRCVGRPATAWSC